MTSAPVAYVASNKYIILSQKTYVIHNNNYNYNKLDQRTFLYLRWIVRENKLRKTN